jgi:hypothetical protein
MEPPNAGDPEQHMNMLVTTLEGVAKDLIDLLNDISFRFYEFTKPSVVCSEPPTPLAAPLPEYFVFESSTGADNDQ